MSEKKPYRVTLTREETVWILAESAEQAEHIGRFDERDILYDVPADVVAYEEKSSKIEEVMHNDDRTVAEFLRGDPSHQAREEAARARWEAKRPAAGDPVAHAAWLADGPGDISSGGEHVSSACAMLRVHGAALPECGRLPPQLMAKTMSRMLGETHRPVTRGVAGSHGGVSHHYYGAAAIDDALVAMWLPGEPHSIRGRYALEAVVFAGPGWEAVIMPVHTGATQ